MSHALICDADGHWGGSEDQLLMSSVWCNEGETVVVVTTAVQIFFINIQYFINTIRSSVA